MQEKRFETRSPEETYDIGRMIGNGLSCGDVVALYGELGTGKTIIAKGIAKSLGIDEHITSPTYTYVREYQGRYEYFHFDMYRMEGLEDAKALGLEEYFENEGVFVIEWADRAEGVLPKRRMDVYMKKDMEKGIEYRNIRIRDSR